MYLTNPFPGFCPKKTNFFSSYDSLFLLLALLGLRFDLVNSQNYTLVIDAMNSPPAVIPNDPTKLVYSVPLNQLTSRPIIAYIQDKTGKIVTSHNINMKAYVTSMNKFQKNPADSDKWRDSGGMLCQWSNPDEDWPMRLNRELYYTVCGSSLRNTTLIIKVLKGKVIMDWLMHVHLNGTRPTDDRFIRIEIPDLKLSNGTNLFRITEPAASLDITKQPPKNITANTKFDITAEIRDRKGNALTVGLDSVAYVELTVAYNHKVFHHTFEKDMMLKSSITRLGGPLVTTYQGTRDLVIRQRAVAGKVNFNDVRLLDSVYDLQLNLTMFMSRDPFLRIPNCEKCYSDLNYKTVTNDGLVKFHTLPSSVLIDIPSMKFTHEFNVLPQKFAKLKYISPYEAKNKIQITRNFPIPGPLTIETQDANGNRIYSGPDSKMPLDVKAIPSDVCLSVDYSAISSEGIAKVVGSICDIKSSVTLVFYSKKMPDVNATSQEFEVIGNVHIAHFDHFKYTGAGREISPHINSFVRFAATDVNDGIIPGVLRQFNMKLILDTIETKDDISNTILQYRYLRDLAESQPANTLRAAILSGNAQISSSMVRELFRHQTSQISLDEKGEKFTDFPLFNRVCWNSRQIYRSFFIFCSERHWNRMIVLKTTNTVISRSLNHFSRRMKINLQEILIDHEKVQWKSKDPDINEVLSDVMDTVINSNIKIIACFANYTQMPAILYIAKKKGLTSEDGYQWIFVSKYAWAFPFNNTFSCDIFPECTTVFGGTILFTETYNTSFFTTKDWERVLNYYYSVDKSIYFGLRSVYPTTDTGARMALGYDAILLYAIALTNIASKRLTATTEKITEELRKVTFLGLSGILKLDENGDRDLFQADIRIINATEAKQPMEKVAPLYKYIVMTHDYENIEYVYEEYTNKLSTNESILNTKLPVSTIYNIHSFKSKSGRVSKTNFQFIKYANESWPSEDMFRKEKTLPPFICNVPCGKRISEEDENVYDRGICVSIDACRCYPGYFGTYCQNIMCTCGYGYCKKPFKCICYKGYTGDDCNIPSCTGGCVNGKCVQPNKCLCFQSFWVGRKCNIHLAAILVPFLILLILFIFVGYILVRFLRKRIERASALSNLDWLVDWREVINVDKCTIANKSMVFISSFANGKHGLCTWRKRNWFLKKINSNTIDQDDINMHLEMVELISINHQNLITYGGACIVNPNVSFLSEPSQKGSLENMLTNETIHLDWHFRFSFLKDICRGMNYLHTKTNIGSHGRLKSSNCVLDNRWCIKITDFGAPTIRYGPNIIQKSKEEKEKEYFTMQEALLWTAPELVESASCLDDVRTGTKEGDVYSFGIIASEIATRDVPFAYERSFLSTCAVIDLIVNRDHPLLKKELEIWESLDHNSNIIRPYIHPDDLPEGEDEQIKFLKMLDDVWCNDPLGRITFQKLNSVLDDIFPTKGGLMDNLMRLLESYLKNLERIVMERTTALNEEKIKVDNIVSQMLPKNVIEKLKAGNKVDPENFECVTVYYSDIVGFTTIAKSCKPMQVVDLLNELYNILDNILELYDVYKVETIGDAYVVSSGVPVLNGNLHAGEIATASLDVMSTILTKKFCQLPDVKLQLRLGINTGPVVAGVVGLKMPRYTLFGETMQIASTMESSSKPMHIQMSEYTADILKELGDYSMIYRGNMDVCGKNIDTYWLTGKKTYRKPLPQLIED